MNKLTAICDIDDGAMKIIHRDKFATAVKCLAKGRYVIKLEKIYRKRSNQQNKSWWGLAYDFLLQGFYELGYDQVDLNFIHEWAKANCLPPEYVERLKKMHEEKCVSKTTGEILNIPFRLTTTELTTIEGMEYYQNMQRLGAELLGVDIPEPNE